MILDVKQMSQNVLDDSQSLISKAEKLGVKYFLVSYTCLNEASRFTIVPVSATEKTLRDGCGPHPALFFEWPGTGSEMRVIPDPDTLIQLPWKPEYGWLSSNIYMDGKPFVQCPRRILRQQIDKAKRLGYELYCGIEPEFVLLKKGSFQFAVGDDYDMSNQSFQEPMTLMKLDKVLKTISESLDCLGWGPYQIDKEAAPSQIEINFAYTDALNMADRFAFFKYMVKDIADIEGYRATFMPQPFPNIMAGSGCHVNMSLWRGDQNVFVDETGPNGISPLANQFMAGILKQAICSAAITNASVNSYKRINNAAWAPGTVTYGLNNRLTLMRIPSKDRLEQRLADATSNPYLLTAVLLAAGMDGITNKLDPGECCTENVDDFPRLPDNLFDALREMSTSSFMVSAFGEEFVKAYVACKKREWNEYSKHVTTWEQQRYLNC